MTELKVNDKPSFRPGKGFWPPFAIPSIACLVVGLESKSTATIITVIDEALGPSALSVYIVPSLLCVASSIRLTA